MYVVNSYLPASYIYPTSASTRLLSLSLHLVFQEKKVQQELERQRAREEEEREMALVDNPRLRERGNLESLLGRLQLSIIDIPPDGNWCGKNLP